MIRSVLLVASATPSRLALPEPAERLAAAGYNLDLVVVGRLAAVPSVEFAEVVHLEPVPSSFTTIMVALSSYSGPDGVRHRRGTPQWAVHAVRWRVARLVAARYRPSTNRATPTWRAVSADEGARALARRADAVIALDRYAVYSAWRLHKRLRVPAYNGMNAGARALVG
jgi:hypothetical protein